MILTTWYSSVPANSIGPKLSSGEYGALEVLDLRHSFDKGPHRQVRAPPSWPPSAKQLYGLAPADDRALLLDERRLALRGSVVGLPDVVTVLDSRVVTTLALG